MISIIIPVYNQAKKLNNCLESIKKQSFGDYEVIVVNDGSEDDVDSVIDKYKKRTDERLVYIKQENKGAPAARNAGFKRSDGEFLLFCDADIIMEANMLEEMREALRVNPDAGFTYSSHRFGKKLFKLWSFDEEKLKQMPYLHSTSLIRKECFPESGWDESVRRLQDWDLFLTIVGSGYSGIWIDKVLFTIDPGGTMSNWLPAFAYKLFPFLPSVKKYNRSVKMIKEKHGIL